MMIRWFWEDEAAREVLRKIEGTERSTPEAEAKVKRKCQYQCPGVGTEIEPVQQGLSDERLTETDERADG